MRSRRGRLGVHAFSFGSPDFNYSPGLGQVLVDEEGVFRSIRLKVAIPYNYEQPSSSTGIASPEPMKRLFQWSDDEGEDSGYASLATVSSIWTDRVSVHMVDNDNGDLRRRLEAQGQTSKAQQAALDNIQQMNFSLTEITMIPGVIIMRKNIIRWTTQDWEIKGKFFYGCWSS